MKIIVGSKNPVKIECVKEAFSRYFENIEVTGKEVNSKVFHQPKSEKETIKGAKNRTKEIFEKYNPNYAVGIEGGLEYIGTTLYTFAWICIMT